MWYGKFPEYDKVIVAPGSGWYLVGWDATTVAGDGSTTTVTGLASDGPATFQILGPTTFLARWKEAIIVNYLPGDHAADGAFPDPAVENETLFTHVAPLGKFPAYANSIGALPEGRHR